MKKKILMYSKFQITYLEMVRDSWSIRHGFYGECVYY